MDQGWSSGVYYWFPRQYWQCNKANVSKHEQPDSVIRVERSADQLFAEVIAVDEGVNHLIGIWPDLAGT